MSAELIVSITGLGISVILPIGLFLLGWRFSNRTEERFTKIENEEAAFARNFEGRK